MMNIPEIVRVFCFSLIFSGAGFPIAAQNGDWVGGFERAEGWSFIQLHFETAKDKTVGTIDFPIENVMGEPLANLRLNSTRIHFETKNHLSFDGTMTNGAMTGNVRQKGETFPFRCDQIANINVARYAGDYEVEAGHFITMQKAGLNLLVSLDSRTGQARILFPHKEGTFFCGPAFARTYPVEAIIRFTGYGQSTVVEWKAEHAAALVGKPIKVHEEEVSFDNGNIALAGTLILPPTKGPHPAMIFLHGSGPSSRNEERVLAKFFALNGVAGLIYDKRGVGASKGDWVKSSFDDLAGDALAGVELLRHRADIDSRRIGLWGGSQGGWLVGLAASRSTNVAFIISQSGPGVSPEEQGAFSVEQRMRTAGFSEEDIMEALSLYRWNSRCARTGTGWAEHEAAVKVAKGKPWYNHDTSPYDRHDQLGWRLICDYDPVPTLQKVQCPVLAFFGELDALVPVKKSAEIWQSVLAKAGNQDVTIKVFPNADHSIMNSKTGIPGPEYFTFQRDWLLKHVQH